MTEYDFSPEAQEAYQRKLRGVENWAHETAQFSPVNPFETLPSAVGSPTNEFFDTGVHERTGRTKHKSKKYRTEDRADYSRSRSRHHDGERHHRHRGDRSKHHNRHHRKDGRVYQGQGQAWYGASTHSLAAPEYYGVRHQASAASLAQPQAMMKGGMPYPPLPAMPHKMYAAHPGPMPSPMMNVQSPPPPYGYQHPPVRPHFFNRPVPKMSTTHQPTFGVAPLPFFPPPVQPAASPYYGVEQNGIPKKSVVSGFMSKLFGGRKTNERVSGKGAREMQTQGGPRIGKQARQRRDSF